MEYETTIGIEIHVELKTKTKMFSYAPNTYHKEPNSKVALIDLAMPGTMPLLNKEAVRYGIKLAKALHMSIDHTLYFDRKNYFYPDLPKGYQITQQDRPIGSNGYLDVVLKDGTTKRIFIQRAHLEEDTCKQTHLSDVSLEDYNRCGIPLIEIVTEPCITNGEEAAKYVEGIREIVTFLDISEGRMDEGSMRCDTNVSIRPVGQKELGVKCEVKNINTIQNIETAIAYEVNRQIKLKEEGKEVEQETRRFDEKLQETVLMRKKTNAVDYKYFREPNLPPFDLSEEFINSVIKDMATLPSEYRERFKKLGLSNYEIEQLMMDKNDVFYFERLIDEKPLNINSIWNYFMVDIKGYINKSLGQLNISNLPFEPKDLVSLSNCVVSGKINSKQGKVVLDDLMQGIKPEESIKNHDFIQISNESEIRKIVEQVIENNEQVVSDWKHGKDRALGYLVGQVMKESHGKANPSKAKEIVLEIIGPMGERLK